MVCIARNVGAPEKVAYQMVLADVVREVIDATRPFKVFWKNGVPRGIGDLVQVSLAEHVALADNTRRNSHNIDGAVEFDVRGGHEHFVEAATAILGYPLHQSLVGRTRCRGGSPEEVLAFGGGVLLVINHIDDNRQLMDEFVRLCRFAGARVAHELVHHAPQDALCDPDIAVDDPYDLSWGLAIGPADISYFRIRSQGIHAAVGAV